MFDGQFCPPSFTRNMKGLAVGGCTTSDVGCPGLRVSLGSGGGATSSLCFPQFVHASNANAQAAMAPSQRYFTIGFSQEKGQARRRPAWPVAPIPVGCLFRS